VDLAPEPAATPQPGLASLAACPIEPGRRHTTWHRRGHTADRRRHGSRTAQAWPL